MPIPARSCDNGWVMHAATGPQIILSKHHGLGNDFLIAVEPPRPLDGADAQAWCDRRQGIGADGLIQAVAAGSGDRWRMTLWNADGGRAEVSGNGLRCLAQALADHLGHDRAEALHLTVETDAGDREATVVARNDAGPVSIDLVRVAMGKAVDGPAPSPRLTELGLGVVDQVGVDLGNPHLVGFVDGRDGLDGMDMGAIGPQVETDHPGGLNVHLVRVVDRSTLEMVIWERGAGVTLACGSGACAAAWAADRAGLVDGGGPRGVEVVMPGGSARVDVTDEGVILTGLAVRVGEVRLDG